MDLAFLGSEDDSVAERAYWDLYPRISVGKLLRLVRDEREDTNVRFYAARMLGNRLAGAPEDRQDAAVDRLRSLGAVRPGFFNSNYVNREYFGK